MSFLEIHIPVKEEKKELLTALLSSENYDSFLETENEVVAYIPSELFDQEALSETLNHLDLKENYEIKELEDKNWNEEWEKNYDPVFVDNTIHIRASFHASQNFKHEILITPKMSFGTGHHATTSLVMSQQLKLDHTNKKVLDAGCGTGVLSILAEQLGAQKIVAYDFDEWAFENTKENFENNNCKNCTALLLNTAEKLDKEEVFEIILANINKNVLLDQIPYFFKRLAPDGKLILSGFYTHDNEDIIKKSEEFGLKFVSATNKDKWSSLIVQKNTD